MNESKYVLDIAIIYHSLCFHAIFQWSNIISKIEKMRGKNMSKLKKRELERKGQKKQKILDTKLMGEHLGDLTKKEVEVAELPED